jgi:hypothetical protein
MVGSRADADPPERAPLREEWIRIVREQGGEGLWQAQAKDFFASGTPGEIVDRGHQHFVKPLSCMHRGVGCNRERTSGALAKRKSPERETHRLHLALDNVSRPERSQMETPVHDGDRPQRPLAVDDLDQRAIFERGGHRLGIGSRQFGLQTFGATRTRPNQLLQLGLSLDQRWSAAPIERGLPNASHHCTQLTELGCQCRVVGWAGRSLSQRPGPEPLRPGKNTFGVTVLECHPQTKCGQLLAVARNVDAKLGCTQ